MSISAFWSVSAWNADDVCVWLRILLPGSLTGINQITILAYIRASAVRKSCLHCKKGMIKNSNVLFYPLLS